MLIYLTMLEDSSDKEWFAKLYDANYRKMYGVVYGMLENRYDAENAVNEAFLSIIERKEYYRGLNDSQALGLCIIIAKNKAIDILRKKKHFTDADVLEYVVECEQAHNPEDVALIRERREEFRRLLGLLPEALSATLVLKYYYGYSNREISKILNVQKKWWKCDYIVQKTNCGV